MSKPTFTGYGPTFEHAFDAAAKSALATLPTDVPDRLDVVRMTSMTALYGSIVGHVGTRVVEVFLDEGPMGLGAGRTSTASPAKLALKFEVLPDMVFANLMPPVRRPQPHRIGMVLTVSNMGGTTYSSKAPTSTLARFSVLRGRKTVWTWPEVELEVVTPIQIAPGQSVSYTAIWEMPDAVDLVHADLTAVALFVPSHESAYHAIDVDAVH